MGTGKANGDQDNKLKGHCGNTSQKWREEGNIVQVRPRAETIQDFSTSALMTF